MNIKFRTHLLAGALMAAPIPAFAAPQEAPEAEVMTDAAAEPTSEAALADAKAKMQAEMDKVIAMIEAIFEVDKLPPPEPARLALAQQTTAALVPSGSLEKTLDNLYGKVFKAIMEEADGMSDLSLSIKTGVESDKIAALDTATKAQVADLFDPHRKEREEQIMTVVKPLISEALGDLEPPMREGMARAYARKFTAEQLTEMNGFFATPAGSAFAGEWMAAQADPEVMIAMIKAIPPMITKFMDRGPELEGKFKDFPKEKSLADLSDAELGKLAKLMKVDVKTLKENRDLWNEPVTEVEIEMPGEAASDDWGTADAAAEAAADAAEAAAAAVDDPAYDRGNWSAADLQRVEELEAASDKAALAAYEAAEQAATNARKKQPD